MYSTAMEGLTESILFMGAAILAITFTNSILSTSIGLMTGQLKRAAGLRAVLLIAMFGVFSVLYSLREIPPLNCSRILWDPRRCDDVLAQILLIDSFQAVTFSFLDGGTAMATGLHDCGGGYPFWGTYKQRHLMATGVTVLSQLALSCFFLHRASLLYGKKKA